jgi:hypothetical protein
MYSIANVARVFEAQSNGQKYDLYKEGSTRPPNIAVSYLEVIAA